MALGKFFGCVSKGEVLAYNTPILGQDEIREVVLDVHEPKDKYLLPALIAVAVGRVVKSDFNEQKMKITVSW